MAPRRIHPTQAGNDSRYPSLKQHLSTRRRFLAVTGASVAASGLAAACSQPMGPGAEQNNNNNNQDIYLDGDVVEPQYYTVRIPEQGETYVYLWDGACADLHIVVATYDADSYHALLDNLGEAADSARGVIEPLNHGDLENAQGLAAAENAVAGALDGLIQDVNGHDRPTVEGVTLEITYLDPYCDIMGGIGDPSYP